MSLTLNATETEVYAGAVLAAYQHLDYFNTEWAMFYGMRPTEVLNIPVTQAQDATNQVDGVSHTNPGGASQINGIELPLDVPLKGFSHVLQSQVDVRPDLNLLHNVGMQHGKDVGRGRTLRIAGGLTQIAQTAGNTATVGATATPDGDAIKGAIEDVGAQMDTLGVDPEGRYMMLKSADWYKLYGSNDVVSVDYGGQAGRQTAGGNMGIINYMGFTIRNMGYAFGTDWTNAAYDDLNIPTTGSSTGQTQRVNMTKVHGIAWQEDSWAARHQTSLQISTPYIDDLQSWLLMARLHMGFTDVKTEGLWILDDSSV